MLPERITDLKDDELLDLSKSIDKDFFKLNFSLTDFQVILFIIAINF